MKKSKMVIGILVVVFLVVITVLVGKPLINFCKEPEKFQIWVEQKGVSGVLIFMLLNMVQVFLAVLPGGVFEIAAGYAFGSIKGAIICDISMSLASLIVFLFVRKFGMKFVTLFVEKEKIESLKWLKTTDKSKSVIFLLFLIPGMPKDLLCYFVGLTDMNAWLFLLINVVARFPAIFLSSMSGGALGSKRYEIMIIMIAVILVLYVLGMLFYRSISKKKQADGEEKEEK